MALLKKEFAEFHDKIKLKNIDDNQPLRDKRNMLIDELRDWGKKNKKPSFVSFNQGSYDMKTGIKPINKEEDYDIDVGINYNIDIEDDEYEDPTTVKKWVVTALSKANRTVEVKEPCVRVQYYKKGEDLYHVDFAIYGNKYKDEEKEEVEYLALGRGKLHAKSENKYWEEAEPKRLKELLNDKFSDEEKSQFKRVICYFKRWKDNNFSSNGNARPTGIAMTAIAYEWFQPKISKTFDGKTELKDLIAFKDLVNSAINNNYGLDVTLPVLPNNNLFEKLKNSEANTTAYKENLQKLYDALKEADNEVDPHEAAKKVNKILGDDFPIPDKKDTAASTIAPAISTSTMSA